MKKIFKILTASVLSTVMCLSMAACTSTEEGGGSTAGTDNMFREDNDFENDTNLRPERDPQPYTIKLGANAKFADGSTEKIWLQGTELILGTDIIYTGNIPENKIVGGWFDQDNNFYEGGNFEVLRKDMTITPALDVPADAYAATSGGTDTGKLGIGTQRTNLSGGQDAHGWLSEWRSGIVDGEVGGIYHFLGGESTATSPTEGAMIPAGFCVMIQTPYQVVSSNSYTIEYKVQNLDDKAVSFRIHQTNASREVTTSGVHTDAVTVKPGETITLENSFSGWTNGNVLMVVELTAETDELNLGIIKSITDVVDASQAEYSLTLTGGAKLENGETSGQFKAGAAVKLVYEEAENETLIGWANADNPSEAWPADGFVMPQKDITVKPIIEKKVDTVSVTLEGGATFTDGSTTKEIAPNTELTIGEDIKYETAEGSVFMGWKDSEGKYYAGETIVIPMRESIAFNPVTIVDSLAGSDGTSDGKVKDFASSWRSQTAEGAHPAEDNLKPDKVNGVDGMLFHLVGGTKEAADPEAKIAKGWYGMFQSAYRISSANKYVIKFTVENKGTEDVSLKFYQTGASGNAKPEDAQSEAVTVKAGGVATVYVVFQFASDNNNMMSTFELLNEVSELKLGMYAHICKIS